MIGALIILGVGVALIGAVLSATAGGFVAALLLVGGGLLFALAVLAYAALGT